MQDTGIAQEIAALREQIAAVEASIHRYKSLPGTGGEPSVSKEDVNLGELEETRDFMVVRLSRLESCQRTPEA